MSAPNTNLEEQKKRHKGPLSGMKAVVGFAAVLLVALVVYMFAQQDGIEGAEEVVDGRTGEIEPVSE